MITLFCICVILAWAIAAQFEVYLRGRDIKASEARYFIERTQMQSKVDILTEALLHQNHVQVDLNKHVRTSFKQKLHDNAFSQGWKSDAPATPPAPASKKETKQ